MKTVSFRIRIGILKTLTELTLNEIYTRTKTQTTATKSPVYCRETAKYIG